MAVNENGHAIMPKRITPGSTEAIIVDFPLDKWRDSLSETGEVIVSLSAGAYVCNYLYFRVLSEITKSRTPALFVHLPMIPEQLQNKSDMPSMNFETQKKIMHELISIMMVE